MDAQRNSHTQDTKPLPVCDREVQQGENQQDQDALELQVSRQCCTLFLRL